MDVLVIGASGTIGRAVAGDLAGRHRVLASSRSRSEHEVDIRSAASVRRLFERVGPVDAVVCVAGEAIFRPLTEQTDEDAALGLTYKLTGQLNVVRVGLELLRDNGSFTLTSGITSRQPIPGSSAYSTVNAGIEGFVRGAALDLPRGIRINAVCPNWVDVTLAGYGMDPAWGVPVEQVVPGFAESVEGGRTGQVIDAGWSYDWAAYAESIGVPVPAGA
jgi:NAD(P)-dependent dehydrogenase (short-subunit alcohol dehydrogenase family)